MRTASSCVVVALAISIATPITASAQTAEAEVLFREGQRLMKEEQYPEACEKFEASERMEPASGTEINLARCREKNGQTASAWAMYIKAAASAKKEKNDVRVTEAKSRAKELVDDLVYLTIEVPAEAELDDLVIKRNKVAIDRELWNQKVPVDPDDYTITAEAPGHKKWSEQITVKTKNKVIEVPPLEKRKGTPPDGDEHEGDEHDGDEHDGDKGVVKPPRVKAHPYRSEAITLAVIGGGSLVLGSSLGLYASRLESQSDSLCPMIKCADVHGVELNKTARSYALVANISWGLGGAALITAGVLWYVGRPSPADHVTIAPVVDRSSAGLAVGGRF